VLATQACQRGIFREKPTGTAAYFPNVLSRALAVASTSVAALYVRLSSGTMADDNHEPVDIEPLDAQMESLAREVAAMKREDPL
jgi:hypothetical protein